MFNANVDFADKVTQSCFNVYKSLGKKGKPQIGREWTKMACFVMTDNKDNIEVLTLATGTKCIGENQRSVYGNLLNDSHAEILARRLFLKYLYKQIREAYCGSEHTILRYCRDTGKCYVKAGVKIHLFSTDIPCGDASIFLKETPCTPFNELSKLTKRKVTADFPDESSTKKLRVCDEQYMEKSKEQSVRSLPGNNQSIRSLPGNSQSDEMNVTPTETVGAPKYSTKFECDEQRTPGENNRRDIHRTGAKCVPNGNQDLLQEGEDYHVTGALRIKPGRGDRTLSMCCSDKIMKWCVLGLNGGLLSHLIKTQIYLITVVVSKGEFHQDSFIRALSTRNRCDGLGIELETHQPFIIQSSLRFSDSKNIVEENSGKRKEKITPAGTAILWCPVCDIHEVSASGRKHGITKKDINTSKAKTSICKENLFTDFKTTLKMLNKEEQFLNMSTYHDYKHACQQYCEKRNIFFSVFNDWVHKPKVYEEFMSP